MSSVYKLKWDLSKERAYQHGIDRGVWYGQKRSDGGYANAEVWNGLKSVSPDAQLRATTEVYVNGVLTPQTNARPTAYTATIESYTLPKGVETAGGTNNCCGYSVGFQKPKLGAYCYRRFVGNGIDAEYNYEIVIVYNAMISLGGKVSTSDEANGSATIFGMNVIAIPSKADFAGISPTAEIAIPRSDSDEFAVLESILYGSEDYEPSLPPLDQVINLIKTGEEPWVPVIPPGGNAWDILAKDGDNFLDYYPLETHPQFSNLSMAFASLASSLATVAHTGYFNDLINIPPSFPPSAHTHEIDEVDGLQDALDTKAGIFTIPDYHIPINSIGGNGPVNDSRLMTANTTANSVMYRDSVGRSRVVAPLEATHIANKSYVDLQSPDVPSGHVHIRLGSGTGPVDSSRAATSTSTGNTIMLRAPSGRIAFADGVAGDNGVTYQQVEKSMVRGIRDINALVSTSATGMTNVPHQATLSRVADMVTLFLDMTINCTTSGSFVAYILPVGFRPAVTTALRFHSTFFDSSGTTVIQQRLVTIGPSSGSVTIYEVPTGVTRCSVIASFPTIDAAPLSWPGTSF